MISPPGLWAAMEIANSVAMIRKASNRYRNRERRTRSPDLCCIESADYGIDTIQLSFLILFPSFGNSKWEVTNRKSVNGQTVTHRKLEIGSGSQTIRAYTYSGYESCSGCSLYFHPSRFVDPYGIGLCRPRDLPVVVGRALTMIEPYVGEVIDPEQMRVRRVDVARNLYEIADPPRYLEGLRIVPRPYARFVDLYVNPRTGVPETLTAGTKNAGRVRLYDKYAQAPHLALPGTMRVEVEARGAWCKRLGLNRFGDLTATNLVRLVDDRIIDWFGLEAEVMTFETACMQIVKNQDLSDRLKVGLLRYLLARLQGQNPETCSKTAGDYRRRLKDLGIAPYLDSAVDFSVTRLDFDAGTELRVA